MLRSWKLDIHLDRQSDKPVYLQIADVVIQAIQTGRLKGGDVLPGSRHLAEALGVNRNTVIEALNVLVNEGWLLSKDRRGMFVPQTLPAFSGSRKTSGAKMIAEVSPEPKARIVFDDGYPDSKIAPVAELARAYRQLFSRKARWQMMGYGCELGDIEFRKAIAQMLNHQRGMHIHEGMVCITRGSQMGMYLAAQCLLGKGDYVLVESPGYRPAWKAFELAGAKLLPVRVDREGLSVDDVAAHLKSCKNIKAIYTTPHRQYPTTVTLSLPRRLALLKLADEYGFTVIEDDYDNEFHFGYRPVFPLCSVPESGKYVYIGTLSKVVAPALRIGYVASNLPGFIGQVGERRKIIDVQGDTIMEQAVLQLIHDGTVKRHIKKATHHYRTKRDFAASVLKKHFKNKATFEVPEGGLAFWVTPKTEVDWIAVSDALQTKGIQIITPDAYGHHAPVNGVRLGYASLSEAQWEEGIKELAKLF